MLLVIVFCCCILPHTVRGYTFGQKSSALIGQSYDARLEEIYINGTQLPYGQELPDLVLAEQLSCIDREAGVFYSIGCNSSGSSFLVGRSVKFGGSVLSRTLLPFASQTIVGAGQSLTWDPVSRRAIVGGQRKTPGHAARLAGIGSRVVGWVNVSEGTFIHVAYIPDSLLDMPGGGQSAFNPSTRLLLLQYATPSGEPVLAEVNMSEGKVGLFLVVEVVRRAVCADLPVPGILRLI